MYKIALTAEVDNQKIRATVSQFKRLALSLSRPVALSFRRIAIMSVLAISLTNSLSVCVASENLPGAPIHLNASYYSCASLRTEGTWKQTKGRMANGEQFSDRLLVCATRMYALGSYLRITNLKNNKSVVVRVADRIGKRFATKRIDLSKLAFSRIAELEDGIVPIRAEVLK